MEKNSGKTLQHLPDFQLEIVGIPCVPNGINNHSPVTVQSLKVSVRGSTWYMQPGNTEEFPDGENH